MNRLVNKLTAWPTAKIITVLEYFRELCLKIYCWINTLGPVHHWEDIEKSDLQERNVILMHFWVEKFSKADFEVFGGFVRGITWKDGLLLSLKPVLFTKSEVKVVVKKFRSGKHPNIDLKTEKLKQFTLNL